MGFFNNDICSFIVKCEIFFVEINKYWEFNYGECCFYVFVVMLFMIVWFVV